MLLALVGAASAAEIAAWSLPEPRGSYAVAVSRATYALPPWRAVVDALRTKHDGACILYSNNLTEARVPLAALHPRYVAIVARPEEAGLNFVVVAHRMLRTLDDDPYTDAMWGIVTGYTAEDALKLAKHREPLIVRRGLGGTSALDLGPFVEGRKFDEGNSGKYWIKAADGKTTEKPAPADTTALIIEALNKFQPDLFMTSGHATPDDWQIGYSHRDGQFRCSDGQIIGLDRKGLHFPVRSPNPKIYLPSGNCLIGQIHQPNCMALACLRSAGVVQMFGYVVPTFYGFAGWGVNDYFLGRPGSCTFAQAVLFNQLALVHELETRFPDLARKNLGTLDTNRLGAEAKKLGTSDRDALGLLWDRDVLAFYGDPAWRAGFAKANLAWSAELKSIGDIHTLRLTTTRAGNWGGRPQVFALPKRIGPATVQQGGAYKPVITDDFVLLPIKGDFTAGQTIEVVFRAPFLAAKPTIAPLSAPGLTSPSSALIFAAVRCDRSHGTTPRAAGKHGDSTWRATERRL
jgi:zinc protease